MLSPHPADPTLTTDNLMEMVKEVEHRWEELGGKLNLCIHVVAGKLQIQLSGVHGMAGVVDEYVNRYPTPSWRKVATALQEMKLDKLADEVTTKYVRGMDIADEGVKVWSTGMSGAQIVCIYCVYVWHV